MKSRFFLIPGLGMNISEVALPEWAMGLQNPGFGAGDPEVFARDYTVEDVAEYHTQMILKNLDPSQPVTVAGMSLGGMILSVIASRFCSQLPSDTKFVFYVTSANSKRVPLIDRALIQLWSQVRPGSIEGFTNILGTFFSPNYLQSHRQEFVRYVEYRATGGNGQQPETYFRQLSALLKFDGDSHFAQVPPQASTFVFGGDDAMVTFKHAQHLRELAPEARHITIPGMGHMVHMERPELIPWQEGT